MVEVTIINKLLSNKEFFATANEIILNNLGIFSDYKNMRMAKIIKHFYQEKKVRPTFDDMLLFIENDMTLDEKDYKEVQNILQEQKTIKTDITVEVLKDEVLKFIKNRLSMNLLEKGADFLVGKNKDTTLEALQLEMKKITDLEFDEDLGLFLQDTDVFNEYDMDRVPLGFKPIDDLYGGGLPKGTFNVILAGPHVGKSQVMMFLAVSAAILGMKVVYVTAEMRTNMTRQRIDSCFLKIPTLKLNSKHMTYKEYKQRWNEIYSEMQGNINIRYFPSSTANANNVGKHIEDLYNKRDYEVALTVLDSINLMRPIDTRITKMQKHIWMEAVTIDFREMIDTLNVSMITAAQLNREGMKAVKQGHDVDMTVIGEFFMLGGFADSIIGLKEMYVDDGIVYNDIFKERPTEESMEDEFDVSEKSRYKKDYFTILKMNVIKSRFGIRVGSYIYLGSDVNTTSLLDIGMNTTVNLQSNDPEKIEKAKEIFEKTVKIEHDDFIEKTGTNYLETFKSKRRQIS